MADLKSLLSTPESDITASQQRPRVFESQSLSGDNRQLSVDNSPTDRLSQNPELDSSLLNPQVGKFWYVLPYLLALALGLVVGVAAYLIMVFTP
jgi:hypothetical protein